MKKVPSYLPRAAAAAGVTAADTAGWGGWGIARIYALNRVEGGGLSWGGGGVTGVSVGGGEWVSGFGCGWGWVDGWVGRR